MYFAVINIIKKKLINETLSDAPEDYRKRLYELTQEGERILQAEIGRLCELLQNAKDCGLYQPPNSNKL